MINQQSTKRLALSHDHGRDRGCDYDYAFLETVVLG